MPHADTIIGQAQIDHPNDNAAAVQQFNDWQQEHYRRFKNEVQARFIDWVTTGNKYNVEYNFGVVDVDSIMARIERSKQSMRDNQIVDADGADELQLVILNPRNWAALCRDKVENFYASRENFSIDQVIAEKDRLTRLQATLEALQQAINENRYPQRATPSDPPAPPVQPAKTLSVSNQELKDAYTALYTAQGKLNSAKSDDANLDALKQDVTNMQTALNQALDDHAKVADEWVKYTLLISGMKASPFPNVLRCILTRAFRCRLAPWSD